MNALNRIPPDLPPSRERIGLCTFGGETPLRETLEQLKRAALAAEDCAIVCCQGQFALALERAFAEADWVPHLIWRTPDGIWHSPNARPEASFWEAVSAAGFGGVVPASVVRPLEDNLEMGHALLLVRARSPEWAGEISPILLAAKAGLVQFHDVGPGRV